MNKHEITEKQLNDIKEIILTLKEKNNNLTMELDSIIMEKDDLLNNSKKLQKEKLFLSKKNKELDNEKNILYSKVEEFNKKYINKDMKNNIVFNIILVLIVCAFLAVEFYIFIL